MSLEERLRRKERFWNELTMREARKFFSSPLIYDDILHIVDVEGGKPKGEPLAIKECRIGDLQIFHHTDESGRPVALALFWPEECEKPLTRQVLPPLKYRAKDMDEFSRQVGISTSRNLERIEDAYLTLTEREVLRRYSRFYLPDSGEGIVIAEGDALPREGPLEDLYILHRKNWDGRPLAVAVYWPRWALRTIGRPYVLD